MSRTAQSAPGRPTKKEGVSDSLTAHVDVLKACSDRHIPQDTIKITKTITTDPASEWVSLQEFVEMADAAFTECGNLCIYRCDKNTPANQAGQYCLMGRAGWISPMLKGELATFVNMRTRNLFEELLVFKRSEVKELLELGDACWWNWSNSKADFESGNIPKTHLATMECRGFKN